MLLFYFHRGYSVGALEFVGKIVTVIKAGSVGYLGYRAPGLVFEHIFRMLQPYQGEVFTKSEACRALKGAREMLGTYRQHLRKCKEGYIKVIVFIYVFDGFVDEIVLRFGNGAVLHIAHKKDEELTRVAFQRINCYLVPLLVFLFDF